MIIYKYIQDYKDKEHTKKLLIDDILHLQQPEEFNDPYDCSLNFVHFETIEQWEEHINNNKDPDEKDKLLNQLKDKPESFLDPERRDIGKNNARENLLVSCFTTSNDKEIDNGFLNRLMWSHYGKNHTGLVIGFNTINDGKNEWLSFSKTNTPKFREINNMNCLPVLPVSYSKRKREINPLNLNDFLYSVLTKDEVWNYENEMRIITNITNDNNKDYQLSKDVICSVYFGSMMKDERVNYYKNLLIEKSKRTGIKVDMYKMTLSREEYNLIPEEIAYT